MRGAGTHQCDELGCHCIHIAQYRYPGGGGGIHGKVLQERGEARQMGSGAVWEDSHEARQCHQFGKPILAAGPAEAILTSCLEPTNQPLS